MSIAIKNYISPLGFWNSKGILLSFSLKTFSIKKSGLGTDQSSVTNTYNLYNVQSWMEMKEITSMLSLPNQQHKK